MPAWTNFSTFISAEWVIGSRQVADIKITANMLVICFIPWHFMVSFAKIRWHHVVVPVFVSLYFIYILIFTKYPEILHFGWPCILYKVFHRTKWRHMRCDDRIPGRLWTPVRTNVWKRLPERPGGKLSESVLPSSLQVQNESGSPQQHLRQEGRVCTHQYEPFNTVKSVLESQ